MADESVKLPPMQGLSDYLRQQADLCDLFTFGSGNRLREWAAEVDAAILADREGWMPIESAPKGRTVLVGYHNRAGKWRTVLAHYYLPQTLELGDDWNGDDEGDGFAPEGWYEEVDNSETINFTEEPPILWQELPPAPDAAPAASTIKPASNP